MGTASGSRYMFDKVSLDQRGKQSSTWTFINFLIYIFPTGTFSSNSRSNTWMKESLVLTIGCEAKC